MIDTADTLASLAPSRQVSVREVFGVDSDMLVPQFAEAEAHVPEVDPGYRFDPQTTLAICAGLAFDRRVMIQGYHGTGKSTHIEQVAARLNWPLVRVNLDAHVSRIDLVGKDAIVLKEGKQVTEFREGILPWTLQRPIALVFDEYDAGRPDVMFVIQRVLEASGKLTLLDQNRVIRANPYFRLFATTNTIGWATPRAFTTAPSRSIRARWTAGPSSPRSTTCTTTWSRRSCWPSPRPTTPRRPPPDRRHGPRRRHDPQRLHQRRHQHGHEPPHRDHLGPERPHLRWRPGPGLQAHVPEQVRRTRTPNGRGVLPARVRHGPAGKRGPGEGGVIRLARQTPSLAEQHRPPAEMALPSALP
jgi:hypothetical protein